jgi:hypothetical protein
LSELKRFIESIPQLLGQADPKTIEWREKEFLSNQKAEDERFKERMRIQEKLAEGLRVS